MKNARQKLTPIALALVVCLALAAQSRAADEADAIQAAASDPQAKSQAQAQANPEIQKQRQQAEQQAQKSIDQEARDAIQETTKAIKAIDAGKTDEALAAIERATGKINILVARSPATALIPAAVDVEIIDTAPHDVKAIRQLAKAADKAVGDKDYPAARVLLQGLISELRVRTYNVPLATYPIAMQDAAKLLDQKKIDEAKIILQTALNTLAVIDHVTPLPIVTAEAAISEAQAKRDQNKDEAQKLLSVAKAELQRARELGYAGNDPEYASLNQAISDLEKQLKGNENTESAFARLKEKVSSFFKRQSQSEKKAEVASR